jgi:hypothetical protein
MEDFIMHREVDSMPYNRRSGRMENARSTGHVPIAQNDFVQERLKSFRIAATGARPHVDTGLLFAADTLGEVNADPVRWAISFDGSPQEVPGWGGPETGGLERGTHRLGRQRGDACYSAGKRIALFMIRCRNEFSLKFIAPAGERLF